MNKQSFQWNSQIQEEYELWCSFQQLKYPEESDQYESLFKPMKSLPNLECIYFVYYIPCHPKDRQPYVGATNDLKRRMKQHGVSEGEYEILVETTDIEEACFKEITEQKRLLGKSDNHNYIIQSLKRR